MHVAGAARSRPRREAGHLQADLARRRTARGAAARRRQALAARRDDRRQARRRRPARRRAERRARAGRSRRRRELRVGLAARVDPGAAADGAPRARRFAARRSISRTAMRRAPCGSRRRSPPRKASASTSSCIAASSTRCRSSSRRASSLNVAGRNREVVLGKMLPARLPADGAREPASRARRAGQRACASRRGPARGPSSSSRGAKVRSTRSSDRRPTGRGARAKRSGSSTRARTCASSTCTGVSAIDPQQTSLPDDWKRLPAYPLGLGDTLRLVEKRRGDAEPPPDHLTLERTLWLDFDGRGLTASDTLTGNLRRASRLEMLPPTVLGRVAIGGKDQFITHLEGDAAKTGIEVRQGELSVSADSRVLADPIDLPAVGWNHDFHSVSATLHLPPGFRLLHATGRRRRAVDVDQALDAPRAVPRRSSSRSASGVSSAAMGRARARRRSR